MRTTWLVTTLGGLAILSGCQQRSDEQETSSPALPSSPAQPVAPQWKPTAIEQLPEPVEFQAPEKMRRVPGKLLPAFKIGYPSSAIEYTGINAKLLARSLLATAGDHVRRVWVQEMVVLPTGNYVGLDVEIVSDVTAQMQQDGTAICTQPIRRLGFQYTGDQFRREELILVMTDGQLKNHRRGPAILQSGRYYWLRARKPSRQAAISACRSLPPDSSKWKDADSLAVFRDGEASIVLLKAAITSPTTTVTCRDIGIRHCPYSREDLLLFLRKAPPQWPKRTVLPDNGASLEFNSGMLRSKVYSVTAKLTKSGSVSDIHFSFEPLGPRPVV